jgi:hypothetical protein
MQEGDFAEEKDWLVSGRGAHDNDDENEEDDDLDSDDEDGGKKKKKPAASVCFVDIVFADMLPIEREAARLRKKQKKTAEEGRQEMQLNIEERERFHLPSGSGD